MIIDDEEHAKAMLDCEDGMINQKTNKMPKGVVTLKKLFNPQCQFKKPTNTKTNRSAMQFQVFNIRTVNNPKIINLGTYCMESVVNQYTKVFKQYGDAFMWIWAIDKQRGDWACINMETQVQNPKWVQCK